MKFNYKHLNPDTLKSDRLSLTKEISALSDTEINSVNSLEQFIERVNEIEVLINETDERLCIKALLDSKNVEAASLKNEFQSSVIDPFWKQQKLANLAIVNSPFLPSLVEKKPVFKILQNKLKHNDILKDKDASDIEKKIFSKVDEYDVLLSEMTIDIDGKQMPLVFALSDKLRNTDREKRRAIFEKVQAIKQQYVGQLDELYDALLELRNANAISMGFPNYRDFRWHQKNRSYSPKDSADLCNSIKEVFIPIQKEINNWRKNMLGFDKLMPWDLKLELFPKTNTKYFQDIDDLKAKVRRTYKKIHPDFSNFFDILAEHNHLDFDVRENKSPAWFTVNLPETGVPFVYLMSADANIQGITIVFHETAHAIHHMYNVDKELLWLKHPESEGSELFAMTMEFLSMEYWDEFFSDSGDLAIAKLEKIEHCLQVFRMIGLWDRFQTWAYLHPKHSHEARNEYWLHLLKEFDIGVEGTALDSTSWQDRPLIFRTSFHLITYAIATLGALGIYKEFKNNKEKVIERLIKAMKLGNTATLQEIYETAGVNFDFTKEKVNEIGTFLQEEWKALKKELDDGGSLKS